MSVVSGNIRMVFVSSLKVFIYHCELFSSLGWSTSVVSWVLYWHSLSKSLFVCWPWISHAHAMENGNDFTNKCGTCFDNNFEKSLEWGRFKRIKNKEEKRKNVSQKTKRMFYLKK